MLSSGGTGAYRILDVGGAIDLASLAYAPGGTVTSAFSRNGYTALTVSQGGQTVGLRLSGSYDGEYFHLSAAPSGLAGTLLTAGTSLLLANPSQPMRSLPPTLALPLRVF